MISPPSSTPSADSLTPSTIVPFLGDIFERRGGEEYLGEPVTMSEHMLQSAHFAELADESETVIVASLLHDIGHFTSEFGTFSMTDTHDRHHEEAGALILERFFPRLVVDCVRYHVAAKRFLCATDSSYYDALSPASVHSLGLQGGPMTDDEVVSFRTIDDWELVLRVRHYDDLGKEANLETKNFADYAPMVQRVVDSHCC